MKIHPTAIIHKSAQLADDIEVGPYTIINDNVSIGSGTKIGASCLIDSFATIGKDNLIFTGAIIGSVPQDLKFDGCRSFLHVGDKNIIREYVTMNRSTNKDKATKVGSNNLFMAYSHVAHDCVVGDNVVVANCGALAGHAIIEDNVVIGGLGGVHQFVRIGKFTIIGGCSKAVQDIPPYCMADGHRAEVKSVNVIALRRNKFKPNTVKTIKKSIKLLFFSNLSTKTAVEKIKKEFPALKEVKELISFIEKSKRGISK